VHGIDDIRALNVAQSGAIDAWGTRETLEVIASRFEYAFKPIERFRPFYRPQLTARHIEGPFTVGAVEVIPFVQDHGDITSLGFRVGRFAYSCDLSAIPENSLPAVSGLDVWVLDALRIAPHPSHLSLRESLALIAEMQPREAVLTNMHLDLDYAETDRITPGHVRPAFDGLQIDVTAGRILSPR
jgi:phosphoribosyl 1,2-cyclic phosphate phosphodiesterase